MYTVLPYNNKHCPKAHVMLGLSKDTGSKKRLTNGLTSRFGYNIIGIKEVGVFLGHLFLSPLVPCFLLITTHIHINNIEGARFIFI